MVILVNVVRAKSMFQGSKFKGDISKWNAGDIADMGRMFVGSPLEGNEPDWYKV